MEQVKLPFRADIVGSFLRPERLKKARKDFESGLLSPAALQQIEDEEIEKLIAEQKVVGLQVITDGEFRRSWWHLDFFWGLGGIEKKAVGQGYVFHNLETRPESVKVTGKITGYNHPMIAHFRFIQKLAGQVTQQNRSRISLWLDLVHEKVQRMMPVFAETGSQRTDIYQVVGMDNNQVRYIMILFIHMYIQQIQLKIFSKQVF